MTGPGQKETTKQWDQQQEQPSETTAMAGELSRLLQVKRWEVQQEPFRGFGSPPGRF